MTDPNRAAIGRAMREGSEAGAAGRPSTDCPYDVRSEDKLERLCATLWLRLRARHDPPPVDFTG